MFVVYSTKAFIAYVHPKLKYNSPVWNLYLKKDMLLLESAQKKPTHNIFLFCNILFDSYTDHLDQRSVYFTENSGYRSLKNRSCVTVFDSCSATLTVGEPLGDVSGSANHDF